MDAFKEFCAAAEVTEHTKKFETVLSFIWFHQFKTNQTDITIKEINQYFTDAHLATYNPTYLKKDLAKSSSTTKGTKKESYKLTRNKLEELDAKYLPKINKELAITELANISITPFLTADEIDGARKMAELYIILHCLENSVRNFIDYTLTKKIGSDWWDKAKNKELEQKLKERKDKESKNKWLSPRGTASPLFYLDWGDSVKIIRKFENDFNPYIQDIKFVELRLEELERIRNIIAHNGVIPSKDDFDRVILHFKDWCKQLK